MAKVTFDNRNNLFFRSLKTAVDQYFSTHQLAKTGNGQLYAKAGVLIPATMAIYLGLLLFPLHAAAGILLSGLFGFLLACIGFNIMHDACHGSYSRHKWVNDTLGLSLNAMGGNAFLWKIKHNIIHHTYTNVDGLDDDIAKSPILRQCASQRWIPMNRYQHLYIPFVYAITSFAWIFIMDFVKYFTRKVYTTPVQKMSRWEHLVFWSSKVLYFFFYIVLPIMLVGVQAWAIGFVCMHVAMGLTLALVFQLAHVVEHTSFETADLQPKVIEAEWAVHQIHTTSNFAMKNRLISWFTGGLNYQIEHHLFPRVSHVHYPALSKIVQENCEQFGLPYHHYPTMRGAIVSHFRMMKQLGKKP